MDVSHETVPLRALCRATRVRRAEVMWAGWRVWSGVVVRCRTTPILKALGRQYTNMKTTQTSQSVQHYRRNTTKSYIDIVPKLGGHEIGCHACSAESDLEKYHMYSRSFATLEPLLHITQVTSYTPSVWLQPLQIVYSLLVVREYPLSLRHHCNHCNTQFKIVL